MAIAGKAVNAHRGFIYLRAEYSYLVPILEAALESSRKANCLGSNILGSGYDFDIRLRSGAGAYVCGEETALFESIEGKRGEPRFRPPFPGIKGLFGKPTVLNNVLQPPRPAALIWYSEKESTFIEYLYFTNRAICVLMNPENSRSHRNERNDSYA